MSCEHCGVCIEHRAFLKPRAELLGPFREETEEFCIDRVGFHFYTLNKGKSFHGPFEQRRHAVKARARAVAHGGLESLVVIRV